jgi:ABC-type lipopolysaccharide export system ATPase subunit
MNRLGSAVCNYNNQLKPLCTTCDNSGGQKRKLSLAISFTGQPQFVLCDEPSSGKFVIT